MVRILDPKTTEEAHGPEVMIAVGSGFLSVADDRVSIFSGQAEVGLRVDRAAAQAQLDAALEAAGSLPPGDQEPAEVKYLPGAAQGRGRAVLTRASAEAQE